MSQAITHETDFQINDHYNWEVGEQYKSIDFALLLIMIAIQIKVLEQLKSEVVALDTMNLWINIQKQQLMKQQKFNFCSKRCRSPPYSQEEELDDAANITEQGPDYVIIKEAKKVLLYMMRKVKMKFQAKINNFVDPTGLETLLLALQWDILLKRECSWKLLLEQCIMDLLQYC